MHAFSFRERHEGFLACIEKNKAKGVVGVSIIFDNSDLQYSNNKLLRENLNKNNKITAIVCANDICALNAYIVIEKMGKRIPDDYSIIGFDNITKGRFVTPALSTFNVPREQIVLIGFIALLICFLQLLIEWFKQSVYCSSYYVAT